MKKIRRFFRTISFIEILVVVFVLVVSGVFMGANLSGCAQIEKIGGPITADNPLEVETADTIGYGIGILAAKDDKLKVKIETYYMATESGGITVVAVNGMLDALGQNGPEYQFMAYKLSRLLMRIGGKYEDGKFIDIKPIDPLLLEAGKQAYLLAYKTSLKK
jgi:hypothetical protein